MKILDAALRKRLGHGFGSGGSSNGNDSGGKRLLPSLYIKEEKIELELINGNQKKHQKRPSIVQNIFSNGRNSIHR
jgi:hypothetical protein